MLLFTEKLNKSKYKYCVQDVDNRTGASASSNFFVGNTTMMFSRSNKLRFTVKPEERSGDYTKIYYFAVAGKNYLQS